MTGDESLPKLCKRGWELGWVVCFVSFATSGVFFLRIVPSAPVHYMCSLVTSAEGATFILTVPVI